MAFFGILAALGAYAVLLDHLGGGSGVAISGECLRERRATHEAVAMGLTGVALALLIPAAIRRKGD